MFPTFSIKVLLRQPRRGEGAKMVNCLWTLTSFHPRFILRAAAAPLHTYTFFFPSPTNVDKCTATRSQFHFACKGSILKRPHRKMAHNEGHCSATSMSGWAGMSPELSPQEIRGKKVQFVTAMRPSMIHVFSDGCLRARATDLSSMLEEEGMTRLCDTGGGRAFGLGFKDWYEERA